MEQFNLRVFDHDLNLVDEIHDASSVVWIKRWSTFGEFEIHLSSPRSTIKNGYYIMLNKDPYKVGMIEYDQDDGDGYQYNSNKDYTIKGYSLLFFLYFRISVPTGENDGYLVWNNKPVEDIMYELVESQAVNPINENRIIPRLELSENKHRGIATTFKSRLKYLTNELFELSVQSGLGVTIYLDVDNKKFIFEVSEGINRKQTGLGTTINEDGYVFSQRNKKVRKRTYTHDTSCYKNMAYIGGQGDGEDRTIVTISDSLSGLSRREAFIDARDIADNEKSEDTETALVDRGKLKLESNFREVMNFEYEANPIDYMKLWDLGDTCTFEDDKKEVILHQQVTEVQETYEDGILKIDPVFGYSEDSVNNSLSATTQATIVERTGISAKFTQLTADYAEVYKLVVGKADINELEAAFAKIKNLEVGILDISGSLNAAIADIGTLHGQYADLNQAIINKADINMANIDDASIKSAKIDSVSADKLTAGTIDAKDITVKNLSAENITVGKINGKQIDNSTISKDNLDDLVNKEIDDANQNANDALSGVDHINAQKMIRVTVESTNGILFKNNLINTTLTCRVFSWDKEITETLPSSAFTWTRVSNNPESDAYWNAEYGRAVKTVHITNDDFYERAVYTCDVEIPE